MYKKIEPNNKIFLSKDFEKDKYKFNLILKNLPSETLELYSDEENYIVCRGHKRFPTWIWTKDGIDESIANEIKEVMNLYLTDNELDKFTCKKELYDMIKDYDYLNDDYFEMGFLLCEETKKPKDCEGYLDKPNISDKETLIKYWYDDCIEMNNLEPITIEEAEKDVDKFITSDTFYVWRNNNGKIVSMASYGVVDNQAKLSHVYTPIDERKKGFAANLIYEMTNLILEQKLAPLLYTDYNYIPSNRAYINAGFKDEGILINFSCSKNKIKKL